MPETHDFGKKRFVTTVKYPPVKKLPKVEAGVDTRETDAPYRRGFGVVFRVPFSRLGIVLGKWIDAGGEEDERLRAALQVGDLSVTTEEIAEW